MPIRPAIVEEERILELLDSINQESGSLDVDKTLTPVLTRFNKFGQMHRHSNLNRAGYTFITRPKLNLSDPSLRGDPYLSTLLSGRKNSLPHSVRCYLDSKFGTESELNNPTSDDIDNENSTTINLVDNRMPFIVPLSNTLVSISGFPDLMIESETTDGGFYSEDQTIAIGSDFLSRSYDLSLSFKDINNGYVLRLLMYWIYWIGLVTKGSVIPYPEDIDQRRLCYTCSIYRFVMDESMQHITYFSKATGCFPKSVPIGNVFNVNEDEAFVSGAQSFTIPFQVNKIEYDNPYILMDFNILMNKYFFLRTGYEKFDLHHHEQYDTYDVTDRNNYRGFPMVYLDGSNRLVWIRTPLRERPPPSLFPRTNPRA